MKLLQHLFMHRELSVLHQLADIPRHSLADAGDGQQRLLVLVDFRDLLRPSFQRLGRAFIGAYAKRIFRRHLHQVGGLVKNCRDGFVVHLLCIPTLSVSKGREPYSNDYIEGQVTLVKSRTWYSTMTDFRTVIFLNYIRYNRVPSLRSRLQNHAHHPRQRRRAFLQGIRQRPGDHRLLARAADGPHHV